MLDPATGKPVTPVWRTASVAAATCADANIASTAALVLGRLRARLARPRASLPARLVAIDGAVHTQGGWPAVKTYWYLTRSSGAVALVLLTVSVVIGIAAVGRVHSRSWPRFAVDGVHRAGSLLALVFLAVHIATAVLDSFAPDLAHQRRHPLHGRLSAAVAGPRSHGIRPAAGRRA